MSSNSLKLLNQWKSFGGLLKQYSHDSASTLTQMRFSIYLPPAAEQKPVPVIYYLSGLTCTDENFSQKAGAHRLASSCGVAVVAPDTSPRGANIEGEDDSYDFGTGAGFYVNATEPKWKKNYNMYKYVTDELPSLIKDNFPVTSACSIFGHSMGGHGALICALKNPGVYKSVSAFSPICHPVQCPWGIKAFTGYLGTDQEAWKEYDATLLMLEKGPVSNLRILIDQGTSDQFLKDQLMPEAFKAACEEKGQQLELRMQDGYDHSYFFISTFMEDHIRFHADALSGSKE